jgi:hypothetical protein
VSLHLNPFIFVMADIISRPRGGGRPSKTTIMALSYLLIFSYGLWLEQCRSRNELYPYPIMENIESGYKVVGYVLLGTSVGLLGSALARMKESKVRGSKQ